MPVSSRRRVSSSVSKTRVFMVPPGRPPRPGVLPGSFLPRAPPPLAPWCAQGQARRHPRTRRASKAPPPAVSPRSALGFLPGSAGPNSAGASASFRIGGRTAPNLLWPRFPPPIPPVPGRGRTLSLAPPLLAVPLWPWRLTGNHADPGQKLCLDILLAEQGVGPALPREGQIGFLVVGGEQDHLCRRAVGLDSPGGPDRVEPGDV